MRDLSAHEKHEFQKLQKDLDQKKSEIAELARTKEKLSSRVEEMEHQIADLQEQVCGMKCNGFRMWCCVAWQMIVIELSFTAFDAGKFSSKRFLTYSNFSTNYAALNEHFTLRQYVLLDTSLLLNVYLKMLQDAREMS
jgi:hypothetical protein